MSKVEDKAKHLFYSGFIGKRIVILGRGETVLISLSTGFKSPLPTFKSPLMSSTPVAKPPGFGASRPHVSHLP